jgi:hypothetical protein
MTLDHLRRVPALLGPDRCGSDATEQDAAAPARPKCAALFSEDLDIYRRSFRQEGLLKKHIQGVWKGDEAHLGSKLAAVTIPGEEALDQAEARQDFPPAASK